MQSSAYTKAMMSDVMRALPLVAAGIVLAAATSRKSSRLPQESSFDAS
jgi:hypothetical protein